MDDIKDPAASMPEPTTAPEVPNVPNIPTVPAPVAPTPEPTPAKVEAPAPAPTTPMAEEQVDDADLDVDEIAKAESDALLAAEDAELGKAMKGEKKGIKEKLGDFFSNWWHNKKARYGTIAGVVVLLVALFAIPVTRAAALNSVGLRGSLALTVQDNSTGQPLKNVQVNVQGKTAKTGQDGKVTLSHLKLGSSELTLSRVAFAGTKRKITIGLGTTALGDIKLAPVGAQYTFTLTDFLSGKPITKAQAIDGEATATGDDKGKIVLTIDPKTDDSVKVTIQAPDYRDEVINLPVSTKADQKVLMVPARREVFISKRSGKYDLYKVDADGKNESVLLKGTGNETADIAVVPHPTDEQVALVSTRGTNRNADGYLLTTLTLVAVDDGNNQTLAESEAIKIVGWFGNRLVYVQIAAGASAANPQRYRLISYDYKSGDKKELSSANYYNDIAVAQGQIYVAPSSAQGQSASMFRINADGTGRQTVLSREVYNIFRTDYGSFTLATQQDSYTYVISTNSTTKTDGQPSTINRLYTDSPDKQSSLWVDTRDGKQALLDYSVSGQKDKTLTAQVGLGAPMRWLSNHYVIYRVTSAQETADYVLNLDGGTPKKITDVTNTQGQGLWYYY